MHFTKNSNFRFWTIAVLLLLGSIATLNFLDSGKYTVEKKSQKIFETVLKEEPKNSLAKVLLGFAFLMERFQLVAGKKKDAILNSIDSTSESVKKGELLIKEALQESLDSSVQNLGLSALELAAKVNAYLDVPLKK